MTKKQIWIYEEDYEKLKTFGKPGESVADWMKHSMENFVQMRADLIDESGVAATALSLSGRMDYNRWVKNGWFK
jgi:hypothetical protein